MTIQSNKDTIPVRKGEELEIHKLEDYIREHIDNLPEESLQIEQFPSGHSNLTYLLKIGDWEAVLRRPPLGPVAPKAHDMKRESTILKSIHPYFSLSPKPYLYEDDKELLGAPFFIMERRQGVVLDTEFPKGVEATPENGALISETMVKTLADLHKINYKQTDLVHITKPDGFMERQVKGWNGRYEKAKTDDVEGVEELMMWLEDHVPAASEATIIHYDFKLNNAMFNPNDLTEMTGLFDWEMTTVGDPLADLGVTLSYWLEDSDPELLKQGFGKPSVTVQPGFYTRREFAERYATLTGRDVSDLSFYVTFAYFKLAVIVQQIYYRYHKGQTHDKRFAKFNQTAKALINHANQIAQKGV
ncbi:phosphotransferase family protein [Salinibacillus xinjiangensis]|uniref:phosphotransferase family protein n=1 Tax=Salinibacillus xinjiangensis TaxID=1229268 RepID=UPI002B268B03|nr:phosphotransferase family protein [Salinibacillus xinjiangensis]